MVDVLSKILAHTYQETVSGLPRQPAKMRQQKSDGEEVDTLPLPSGKPAAQGLKRKGLIDLSEMLQTPINPSLFVATGSKTPISTTIPPAIGEALPLAEEGIEPLAPPTEELAWWEQPKVWTGKGMEVVGKGIAQVPILPKALEWAAPAFEFITEKLEKPFAAIISSPFSPSLPWQSGESWLEHEKREYETWNAPTYIKGGLEFAMPLWWLPYFGWAAKGAKALGVGQKLARAAVAEGKLAKIALPTSKMLDDVFKLDWQKTVAMWAKDKPVLNTAVKAMGGEAAFVSGVATDPLNIMKRAYVKHEIVRSMADDIEALLLPEIQKFGNPNKILGVTAEGMVTGVKPKPYLKNIPMGLSDVIEHPGRYVRTPEQDALITAIRRAVSEARRLALEEGVKVPREDIFHRLVKGVEKGNLDELGEFFPSEYGSLFEFRRHYKTMEEGIKGVTKKVGGETITSKVVYDPDILKSVSSTIRHYIRRIAEKGFDDEIKPLGKTAMTKWLELYPTEFQTLSRLSAQVKAADALSKAVTTLRAYGGKRIPSATIQMLRRELDNLASLTGEGSRIGQLAKDFEAALVVKPSELDTIVSKMGRDVLRALKVDEKGFKALVSQFNTAKNGINLGAIDDALRATRLSDRLKVKAIDAAYRDGYLLRKQFIDDSWKYIRDEADNILKASKGQAAPIKGELREFLREFTERPRDIMPLTPAGVIESIFPSRPALKGLIFPKEAVDAVEPLLKQQGQQWLKATGTASGLMRMMTATLDASSAWIQGLPTYGLNPRIWAEAAVRQFEFAWSPQRLYEYMTQPVVAAVRAERAFYGGSLRTFEFFQSLAPLQRAAERIPVVGKSLAGATRQTFGRAEAAFAGFGELARNNLWMALKRPNMTEAQLRDLARTIDRMTGIMDVRRLAVGLTQQQLEQGWIFFSPSYTRAGLAFITDIAKGGISGRIARESLAKMLYSGALMYYGVSKMMGQRPDFDPSSAKFMTIKVGDRNVGIGGIHYSLARLAMNVMATATGDEPMDLIKINRFDNSFLKFLFGRSAMMTGLLIGAAIEQKDFLGRPFEDAQDWGRFLASKVTPIALQSLMEEDASALGLLPEFAGMRVSPKSPWQERNELRDKYAMEQFNLPYDQIPVLAQMRINAKSDIKVLDEAADLRTVQIGDELSMEFLKRRRDRDDAWFVYVQALNQAQKAFDDGMYSGVDFRERLQDERFGYAKTLEHIDRNPDYAEALEKIKERDIEDKWLGDIAYDEVMEWLFTKGEDQYGIFRYEGYDQFLNQTKAKYGLEVMEYVEARRRERNKELPPMAQEYFKAVEILRPYWEIQDQVVQEMGEPRTEAEQRAVAAEITRRRRELRERNPQIAKYYDMFYGSGKGEAFMPIGTPTGRTVNLAKLLGG